MFHFRLRRSIRLAVDLLSLNFAGSFINSRFAPAARGTPASATTVFDPWGLPRFASSVFPNAGFSTCRAGSGGRRYLASAGLMIALMLEACGCNPVGGSSLTYDPIRYGSTGQEMDSAEEVLSFYDPADHPPPSSSLLPLSEVALGPRPLPVQAKSAPWAIPESVYLIYRSRRLGETAPRQPPLATAFVLSMPSRGGIRGDDSHPIRFLVTARHVVDPRWARCSDRNPDSIDLRLNRRAGGVGYETVSLQTGAAPRFFTPSDPTADLAVIPLDNTLIANLDDYKFLDIPFRVLLSESDAALLHAEQPVMTAGLSTLPVSFPVFDAGSLSKMPAEAVGVRCGGVSSQAAAGTSQSPAKLLHVWFISASVPGGVSGAPVFTSIARGAEAIETPVLLGVQSVVWPDKGIAGITPSPMLGDLIRSALRQSSLDPGKRRSP